MNNHRLGAVLSAAALAAGVIAIAGSPAAAGVKPHAAKTLWVAPTTAVKGESAACLAAKYHAINPAIKAAVAGDTVKVCAGTYTGSVTITTGVAMQPKITTGADIDKSIKLVGLTGAAINATGLDNGATFFGVTNATVEGFTITGAIGEGILAAASSKVTIENNVVEGNDNGGPTSKWSECQAAGKVPNDCGEGIHLLSSTYSKVLNNTSEFNSGGILLDDDFGPNSYNTVKGNLVEDNESDCGVTVVGHSASAVNSSGVPTPKSGGTYDNTISDNVIISNGTTGDGGGVLLASGVSGGGSYDNTVIGNEIAGNGLSGVTIHKHFPLSDVSGDVIKDNWIGTNNIDGDFGDTLTTGIFVERDSPTFPRITVTVTDNTIAFDHYGIDDNATPGLTKSGNVFVDVTVDVHT